VLNREPEGQAGSGVPFFRSFLGKQERTKKTIYNMKVIFFFICPKNSFPELARQTKKEEATSPLYEQLKRYL
jgi:hypothetical protein